MPGASERGSGEAHGQSVATPGYGRSGPDAARARQRATRRRGLRPDANRLCIAAVLPCDRTQQRGAGARLALDDCLHRPFVARHLHAHAGAALPAVSTRAVHRIDDGAARRPARAAGTEQSRDGTPAASRLFGGAAGRARLLTRTSEGGGARACVRRGCCLVTHGADASGERLITVDDRLPFITSIAGLWRQPRLTDPGTPRR